MRKNVAGQTVGSQMIAAADGSAFTGSVTAILTGDGGTQGGGGACVHEGNGYHSYTPSQAETNYDHIAFTFTGTGAVPRTTQVYTSFPQTGDSFVRVGAPVGASISADVAAVKTDTAAVKAKTDFLPNATAGAAGGVFIAGTNAATTANITGNITGNLSGSVGSVTGLTAANLDVAVSTRSTYAGADTAGTTTLLTRIGSALTITAGKVDVNDKTGFALSSAGVQAIWDAAVSALTTIGSIGKRLVDNIDAAISSRMATFTYTAPDNTSITAIKTKTDFLPSATAGATGGLFIAGSNAATTVNITGNITGNVSGSVGSATVVNGLAANVITAASIAADAITASKVAADVHQEHIELSFSYNATADYASAAAGSLVKEIADNAGGASLTAADIADAVWDEVLSGHLTGGTTGNALNAAGAAGDPWTTTLPGAYSAGTAGNIIGNRLDVAVSSRSTYAGGDTAGTTTLLTRIAAALTITSGKVDINDKTGFSLSSAGVQAIWDALTSALTTVNSIGKRLVDNIDAAISSRSTYAGGDTSGTTTLLTRLTSTRAGLLDNLDSTISSRLSSAGYTAPDNASIVAIKAKTDNLPASPAAVSNIPTAATIAETVLNANLATGADTNERSLRNAARATINKASISSGVLTVYKEDGTTAAFTRTVTTDAAADPIVSITP